MERNVIDDYIKCEIDLEAVSTLLNKVYDKEKDSLQSHANYKSHIGKMMYEKEEERFSVLTACKEKLDFVINVLKEYIRQGNTQSNSISYKPRVLTYYSDIGKYQTEVIKAKRKSETLHWAASITRDAEKKALYQDCINKLNFVYTHISKK